MKKLILILGLFILTGCSTLGPVPEDRIVQIKRIGVVSLFGDTFHGIYVGGTVFENKKYTAKVSEWKIDRFTSELMLEQIKATNKFQVGLIELGTSKPEAFYSEKIPNLIDFKKISSVARQQNYDTIVLVSRASHSSFPFYNAGYGFNKHCGLFNISCVSCMYSIFTVEVIDVRSEEQIAFAWGYPLCSKKESSKKEAIVWKNDLESYSSQEKQTMKTNLQEQISENLIEALQRLKLIK